MYDVPFEIYHVPFQNINVSFLHSIEDNGTIQTNITTSCVSPNLPHPPGRPVSHFVGRFSVQVALYKADCNCVSPCPPVSCCKAAALRFTPSSTFKWVFMRYTGSTTTPQPDSKMSPSCCTNVSWGFTAGKRIVMGPLRTCVIPIQLF